MSSGVFSHLQVSGARRPHPRAQAAIPPRPHPGNTHRCCCGLYSRGTAAPRGKGPSGASCPRPAGGESHPRSPAPPRRRERQPRFACWSGPPVTTRRGRQAGARASLIHELLAAAQSRGKIDDRLQVLVGGFIKLSAAGRKSDEYSRFRPGSNSPALAIRWIRRRKQARWPQEPRPRNLAFSTGTEPLWLENGGARGDRTGAPTPSPLQTPFKDCCGDITDLE